MRKLSDSEKRAFDPGLRLARDHHWTALGAYYAYEAIAKTMGFDPVPISSYKTKDLPGYLGTSYAETLSEALKKNPDTIRTYLPTDKYQYSIFKDGVVPSLLPHFQEIELIDTRYSKQNLVKEIQESGITDVLFIC